MGLIQPEMMQPGIQPQIVPTMIGAMPPVPPNVMAPPLPGQLPPQLAPMPPAPAPVPTIAPLPPADPHKKPAEGMDSLTYQPTFFFSLYTGSLRRQQQSCYVAWTY